MHLLLRATTLTGMFAVCVIATTAHAFMFCVSTAKELQNALDDASDGGMYNGLGNSIFVTVGTYTTGAATGNGPFHYVSSASSGYLAIYGGYDVNCLKEGPATLAILDGNHATQVLKLRSTSTEVVVQNLTIQNGQSTVNGGGISVNDQAGFNSLVEIMGNVIRNNHSASFGGGFSVGAQGTGQPLQLGNNVVSGNSADNGAAGGLITGVSPYVTLSNNTFARNTTSAPSGIGGLGLETSSGHASIYNNIFWNNSNVGLYMAVAGANLEYNDYSSRAGGTPNTDVGNISVDPQFAGDSDFHLSDASPLIGLSPVLTTYADPDRHVPSAHGKEDVGAYVETIFADGFEGN